jgi:hypothetical protein
VLDTHAQSRDRFAHTVQALRPVTVSNPVGSRWFLPGESYCSIDRQPESEHNEDALLSASLIWAHY